MEIGEGDKLEAARHALLEGWRGGTPTKSRTRILEGGRILKGGRRDALYRHALPFHPEHDHHTTLWT